MTHSFVARCLVFASLWTSAVAMAAETRTNVLLICVDDLRPELACFGASHIESPNIDRLSASGRAFSRHYVQSPTCGASRYALLTGQYGSPGNDAIFKRAERLRRQPDAVDASMPGWFRRHGYTTVSVGKVSHHPGGLGGSDWDDDSKVEMPNAWDRSLLPAGKWQHPRGWMHGLANGEIRSNAGKMDVFQSVEGADEIYPDGGSVDEACRQLKELASTDEKPFFLAVGILRPHLPFGAPAKYLTPYREAELPPIAHPTKPAGRTTWHRSGEFMKYNRWGRDPNLDADFATEVRRHYAACVTYADAQVGRLLDQLAAVGADEKTVVILWGDHGWHLGEHAVWGKHTLFEESLRSPLIVRAPEVREPGRMSESMVETIDVFPTLCELAGLPKPEFADGTSLLPILTDPVAEGHVAVSYSPKAQTIRTSSHRLIRHKDGFSELYDHLDPAGETSNVADDHPKLVEQLSLLMDERLQP